jgi:hypothetical protein
LCQEITSHKKDWNINELVFLDKFADILKGVQERGNFQARGVHTAIAE